jgi:hypothetical protein
MQKEKVQLGPFSQYETDADGVGPGCTCRVNVASNENGCADLFQFPDQSDIAYVSGVKDQCGFLFFKERD